MKEMKQYDCLDKIYFIKLQPSRVVEIEKH